jgi:hypothetical protein
VVDAMSSRHALVEVVVVLQHMLVVPEGLESFNKVGGTGERSVVCWHPQRVGANRSVFYLEGLEGGPHIRGYFHRTSLFVQPQP